MGFSFVLRFKLGGCSWGPSFESKLQKLQKLQLLAWRPFFMCLWYHITSGLLDNLPTHHENHNFNSKPVRRRTSLLAWPMDGRLSHYFKFSAQFRVVTPRQVPLTTCFLTQSSFKLKSSSCSRIKVTFELFGVLTWHLVQIKAGPQEQPSNFWKLKTSENSTSCKLRGQTY